MSHHGGLGIRIPPMRPMNWTSSSAASLRELVLRYGAHNKRDPKRMKQLDKKRFQNVVFSNRAPVGNICHSERCMHAHCIAGVAKTNLFADLPGYYSQVNSTSRHSPTTCPAQMFKIFWHRAHVHPVVEPTRVVVSNNFQQIFTVQDKQIPKLILALS